MKALPLGYQDFKKIIEEDKLYIDKTEHIWNIINNGEVFFLSRPRRFGKSLLISTLEYLFKGEKELFEGLAISQKNYDWKKYPVITLHMNGLTTNSLDTIYASVIQQLHTIANQYSITLIKNQHPAEIFWDLIEKTHKFGPVVILIDEYDKPLLDMLSLENSTPEEIEKRKIRTLEVRNFLKAFYGKLKPADSMLKFVFITGVSKFTKTSIFSDLNHLTDLTMRKDYAALLGYTESELEQYFSAYLPALSQELDMDISLLKQNIKSWYNGFRFTDRDISVYNPYSILSLFDAKQFSNYWFETGTPTFLINLIKEKNFPEEIFDQKLLLANAFSSWDVDKLNLLALMFQTGYLTIKQTEKAAYDPLITFYQLGIPNKEIQRSLMDHLLSSITDIDFSDTTQIVKDLVQLLIDNDLPEFFNRVKSLFANLSYELHIKDEHYYQSLFFILFTLIGMQPRAEEQTNQGRIDLTMETSKRIFIFEFKLDHPASKAMEQIYEKKYFEKFLYLKKPISLIGVSIDSEKREVKEWVVEEK